MQFKIVFPSGYNINDTNNDNIDIHIILQTGEVYFGTAFTINNISQLMSVEKTNSFWADSMFICSTLNKLTIKKSVEEMIISQILKKVFSYIGNIPNIYGTDISFNEIPDFCNGYDISLNS